jgi:hypothetical protein
MSNTLPAGYVLPTPQPAKTVGLLSIVFGAILLLLGTCSIVSMGMFPLWINFAKAQQTQLEQQATAQEEVRKQADLKGLEERAKIAKTDAEKAEISSERERILKRPKPFVPDTTMGFRMVMDRSFQIYNWADLTTGIPLNILMIVSGIGLMRFKRWSRPLAIWVASLKLLRIAILLAASVMVISPSMSRTMGQEFDKMGQQIAQQQGNNPANIARVREAMRTASRMVGAFITGGYVGYFLLASIFPIAVLVIVNKPGVRAALQVKPASREEGLS